MALEMVTVRVLMLERGDKVHPSYFDSGITDVAATAPDRKHRTFDAADYEDEGFYQVCPATLAASIRLPDDFGTLDDMTSSPNDPVVEMLKPLTVVYFDLHATSQEWDDLGLIGYQVEGCGVFDTFSDYVLDFIAYAKTLPESKSSMPGWGKSVQFMTLWSGWSSGPDWEGEYDAGVDFVGVFDLADIKARPLLTSKVPDPLATLEQFNREGWPL